MDREKGRRERKRPIDMKMGKEQHPFGGYAFEEEFFFYLFA